MPRLIKPPTPEQWAAAAAETLRENDLQAEVGPGPSGSSRVTVRFHLHQGSRVAYVDVYHTLRVAAPGDNGTRERALEVLAGAGYLDGYRLGATGGMRAKMPADIEDAPKPLRDLLQTPRGLLFARLRAWRDELATAPPGSPGRFIAAEIERRFPEAFNEEETT